MKYLDQLQRRAPDVAEFLAYPGGYVSSGRRKKFYEYRRMQRLQKLSQELAGAKVVLHGPAELLEQLIRQGSLDGLHVQAAYCPQGIGELFTYKGSAIPIKPEAELSENRCATILSFSDNPACPAATVHDLSDEDLLDSSAKGAWALRRHVERLVGRARERMEEVFEADHTVLFAGNVEYFNFLRVSEVLRAGSMKTIFLGLTADTARFKESSFDLCLHADGNLEVFFTLLNILPFKVVHFQGWMENHEYAAAAAVLCENPLVVELNDLPHYFLEKKEYDTVFGAGRFDKEETCLKRIAFHADGLLANCEAIYLDRFLDALDVGCCIPRIPFHGYPLRRFFCDAEKPDRFSVVFPGSLLPGNFPAAAFADGYVLRLARDFVIPQGISYHVWANPFSGDGSFERYWDYHYLARRQPLFHLHEGLPPDVLTRQISRFGFGAMFYLLDNGFKVRMEHYASLIPSKVFTLLEGGLPIIYNEEFEYLGQLAETGGLGIPVSQQDIRCGLRSFIEKCDYQRFRHNVAAFRERYSMEEKIGDLLALYEAAASHRACASEADGVIRRQSSGDDHQARTVAWQE